MIKVLIADDHPIVRQGLRQILSATADMVVAGEAVNGQEALDQVRVGGWDVLVLDITMPGRSGFDILKELKYETARPAGAGAQHPCRRTICGAGPKSRRVGVCHQENAPNELVKAIRKW